jgi:histidinol-phosphatase
MPSDLDIALAAADLADRITSSFFRHPSLLVHEKPDSSPVTEADTAVEAAVREFIVLERPADAVVGEEMGESGFGSRRWVVDPIDGTVNFVRGVPVWATLIALQSEGTVEVGVVSAPMLRRRWWGARGHGSFAMSPGEQPERISVSGVRALSEATVSSGSLGDFADPARLLEVVKKAKRDRGFGDFWQHMLVAEGCCEVALDPVTSLWDNAALQVIVEEAGGKFTDFSGSARPDGGSSVSSNGLFHDEVIALLAGDT